jgi:hypothetical protein
MPIHKPARVDHKLLRSFEQAIEGRGDGRVSVKDITDTIAPRFKDAGRLTETEKATLEWAVEEFNLTDAAKRELSDELVALTGGEVFQWQRELRGPVSVRLGDQMPQPQLDKKAAEAFLKHATSIAGDWKPEDMFAHPYSGNSGTHLYRLEGGDAERHLKFLSFVFDKPELLTDFSLDSHSIYSVYESGDEEHFGGVLVDKRTGEATPIDTFNTVDVGYVLEREKFEDIFGPAVDGDGERIPDDDFEDWTYDVDIPGLLGRSGEPIELPNFTGAQEARREGPLRDAVRVLYDAFRAEPTDRRAGWDHSAMGRSNDLDAALPGLVDAVHSADYRDDDVDNAPPTLAQPFAALGGDDKAALLESVRAVAPDITEANLDALLAGLGGESNLEYALMDVPMKLRNYGSSDDTPFAAKAHVLVNKAEGDWLCFYDRPKRDNE